MYQEIRQAVLTARYNFKGYHRYHGEWEFMFASRIGDYEIVVAVGDYEWESWKSYQVWIEDDTDLEELRAYEENPWITVWKVGDPSPVFAGTWHDLEDRAEQQEKEVLS